MPLWNPVAGSANVDRSRNSKRKGEVVDERGGQLKAADSLQAIDLTLPGTPVPASGSDLRRDESLQPTIFSASHGEIILGSIDRPIEASPPSKVAQRDETSTPPPHSSPDAAARSARSIEPLDWSPSTACEGVAAMHQSPLINPAVATQEIMSDQVSELVCPGELHYSPDTDF